MRGIISRPGAALPRHDALAILKNADYGVLATVNPQGQPCVVALNHVVIDEDTLVFHGKQTGEKIDNIRQNPQCSFFVTGQAELIPAQFETAYTSVVAHGLAEIVKDPATVNQYLKAFADRFVGDAVSEETKQEYISKGLPVVALIKLSIEHLTGKARPRP